MTSAELTEKIAAIKLKKDVTRARLADPTGNRAVATTNGKFLPDKRY